MHKHTHPLWLTGTISLLYIVIPSPTQAQIAPDATLGQESSVVITNIMDNGLPSHQIDGGAIRGSNLFHSFEQLNVDAETRAYFTNPVGIENILSRVTGGARSHILGTLGVLGNANLFVINPNGILFGPNASLDVKGSFVATTANAVRLGETGLFSASEPVTSNLLNVNPSALFFNTVAAQAIVNQSQAESLTGELNSLGGPVGLQVPTSQTLALVGGDVVLEGGNLTAAAGRLELGSVAGVGEVSLSQTGNIWVFGYDGIDTFGNIRIEGGALVDVSGEGGGSLQIQGAQLAMTQGAAIFADTLGSMAGQGVLINSTETLTLSENSLITADVYGSGTGGDLTIDTGSLIVQDGSLLSTTTLGEGQGGNLTVTATAVELSGLNEFNQPSSLIAGTQGFAPSGNLTINTGRLLIQGGAQASTSTFGESKAGDLTVRASVVELAGSIVDSIGGDFSSGLLTTADRGSKGNGGNLTVVTEQLLVQDGAQVAATTFGEGNAGNLTITASEVRLIGTGPRQESPLGLVPSSLVAGANQQSTGAGGDLTIETNRLIVQDGAEVQASTLGDGDAGNLTIRASESVELTGTTPEGQIGSGLRAVSGVEGETTDAIGKGGNLIIETGHLSIRDGAEVAVSSTNPTNDAKGAGSLQVQAQTILLDNRGTLTAETASGNGGDISLQVQDLLVLRRNSNISTTAGVAGAGGDGGNININASFLVAPPQENGDIIANAFNGNGGDIALRAQSIFGLQYRNELAPRSNTTSDITASSQFGLAGTVTINTPDVDPSRGLVALPTNLVDASGLIAQSCRGGGRATASEQNQFIVTGRGGLPPSPNDALSTQAVWQDLRPPVRQVAESSSSEVSSSQSDVKLTPDPSSPIVEAQGWVIGPKGQVILTAQAPTVNPHSSGLTPFGCY